MNNCKLILITNKLYKNPIGGREQLCKLNFNLLSDIFGDNLILIELNKKSLSNIIDGFGIFRGYIDGVNKNMVNAIIKSIDINNVGKVFIDGSNLGELSRAIKANLPNVDIYTFFHNVEARFFFGSFKGNPSIKKLAILISNYLAEKKATKYSDHVICLSERDGALLEKWYGRKANYVTPMSIQDKYSSEVVIEESNTKFALFVGGDFYANISGIRWYVENVAPYVDIETRIVGRGMYRFKKELESFDNVKVIGEVDSLEEFYLNAYFVIAPIFDGSGMKTKVAEALMFGKKVIGTSEAFSGYDKVLDIAGVVCNNAYDFIDAVNNSDKMVASSFDNKLRKAYLDNYSFLAVKERFNSFLRM